MNNHHSERHVLLSVSWLLSLVPYALITVIAYYPIWNIDQEGECIKPSNFFECWDIYLNYHPKNTFKKLPSDQYLIDQFNNNEDLEILVRQAKHLSYTGETNEKWIKKFNIYHPEALVDYRRDNSESWKFDVASTMFIKGLDEESKKRWPWVIRTKGYIYSPDNIVNGLPSALDNLNKSGRRSFILQDQLDNHWPDNWVYNQCLLRPIEDNWYLFLCKQQNGG